MAVAGTLEYLISIDSSKVSSGLNAAEGKVKGFGNKLSAWTVAKGQMLGGLITKAGQTAVKFVSSSIEESKAFDKSMSQVAATLGKSTKEIQNLSKFAREMGSKTAFTATEAAEGLNYMALAGYDAEKSMRMLPTVLNLAAAGTMELGAASDMVTDAQSALGLSIEETEVMVDQMAKTSSKTNTSVEQLGSAFLTVGGTAKKLKGGTAELSALLGVLANNGIKGAEGGTALRNVLNALSNPAGKAAKQLKRLKIDAYDKEGNLRSMTDILSEFGEKTKDMSDKKRTDLFAKMFNVRDLKSVEALLSMTKEDWAELTGEIEDSAGAADKMAKTQLDNLAGDMTIFGSALSEAKLALVEGLTPALRSLVKSGTYWLTDLTKNFKEKGLAGAIETARKAFDFFSRKMTRSKNPVVKFLGETLRAFRQGFTWEAFGSTITKGWNLIKDGFNGLGKLVFGENVDGTTKWPTWSTIGEFVTNKWEDIKTNFQGLGKLIFGENVDGTTKWPTATDMFKKAESIWNLVVENFKGAGKLVFGENADGTTNWPTVSSIVAKAQGILGAAVQSFKKATNKFVYGEKADTKEGWPSAKDIYGKAESIWNDALELLKGLTGFDFGSLFSVTIPSITGDITQWIDDTRRDVEQYLSDTFGYEHDHVADATANVEQTKAEADAFVRNLKSHEGNSAATRNDIFHSGMDKIEGIGDFVDFTTGKLKKSIPELEEFLTGWYEDNRKGALESASEANVAEQERAAERLTNAEKEVDNAKAKYEEKMGEVSDTIQKTYNTLTNPETGFFKDNGGLDLLGLRDVDPNDIDQVAEATSNMVNALQNNVYNPFDLADALGINYSDAEDAVTQTKAIIDTINEYDEVKKNLQDASKEQDHANRQLEEANTKQEQYSQALDESGSKGEKSAKKVKDGTDKSNESITAAAESVAAFAEGLAGLKDKTITITTIYRTIGSYIGAGKIYNPNSANVKKIPGSGTPVIEGKYDAKGDWSVPYDDYLTRLHRGEMVLTKSQARQYREGNSGNIDVAGLAASIVAAVREGMAGASVNSYLDGRNVTKRVNRRNTNTEKARRFVTA